MPDQRAKKQVASRVPRGECHAVDPYCLWARVTNAAGYARQRYGDPGVPEPTQVMLEMAVDSSTLPSDFRDGVSPAHDSPAHAKRRFCTTTVAWDSIERLFDPAWRKAAGIRRFELGLPVRTPGPPLIDTHVPHDPLGGDVVAFIDYGCPFAHAHFRGSDGRSRVKFLWDQQYHDPFDKRGWRLPKINVSKYLFRYGGEIDSTQIDQLFDANSPEGAVDEEGCYHDLGYDLMQQSWSHGAHVMDVAAGWPDPLGSPSGSRDRAGNAQIIFVQLPRDTVADASGASMNVYVLDALRYIMYRTDQTANVTVNLSFGSYAGPHDGSSLLEKAIDECIAERGADRFKVVLPAGNSVDAASHAQFTLSAKARSHTLRWEVSASDATDNFVEIWYRNGADVEVSLKPPLRPAGIDPVAADAVGWWPDPQTEAVSWIVHVADASQQGSEHEGHSSNCALVAVAPTQSAYPWGHQEYRHEAPYGIWEITVSTSADDPVTIDAWVERNDPILDIGWEGRQSRFLVDPQDDECVDYPDDQPVTKRGTLNGIATGARTTVVGGCQLDRLRLARYSSAGPGRNGVRPCGPNYVAATDTREVLQGRLAAGNRSGATIRMNGTSVAAPQAVRHLVASGPLTLDSPPADASQLDKLRWGAGRLVRPATDD